MKDDLKEIFYWIFLAEALGYSSSKVKKIENLYESSKRFYDLGLSEWRLSGLFNEKEIFKLKNTSQRKIEKILKVCEANNYKIIPYGSEEYPKRLKEITNPPAVLYVFGNLPKVDEKILISIVGTRNATDYGKNVAFNLGYNFAKNNITVVSGGALGIDSAAQYGAIMAEGKVISVLGCGFNCKYLVQNENLRKSILKNGALVSEYPPDTPAIPRNFPIRNRIISALSLGVLVVEAGEKSGALITANIARKQNKDIFSIPGNINSAYSIGPNNLIKDGAILVTSVKDILKKYSPLSSATEKSEFTFTEFNIQKSVLNKKNSEKIKFAENSSLNLHLNNKNLSNLSKNELVVYNQLDESPSTLDSLVIKSKLSVSTVLECVTALEILGLLKNLPGNRYKKI